MNKNQLPPSLIIGPSHLVRWREHVKHGVVSCVLSEDRLIGRGGCPIWSKWLLNQAIALSEPDKVIAILVGDFRFGNELFETALPLDDSNLFVDGFFGVSQRNINHTADKVLFQKSMNAIHAWKKITHNNVRFIFWDLFCRQIQDRLLGSHIKNGKYRHPVWNLNDVMEYLPENEVIDLSLLLRKPMHELSRLFIDASSHPSQIGYILLNKIICENINPLQAYDQATSEVEQLFLRIASQLRKEGGRPVALTGSSVWLDTLSQYMGATGTQKLAKHGLILCPINSIIGRPSLKEMDVFLAEDVRFFVFQSGCDVLNESGGAMQNICKNSKDWMVIDWEESVFDIITSRGETPKFKHSSAGFHNKENKPLNRLKVSAPMVELGPTGAPSLTGLIHVLQTLISNILCQSTPSSNEYLSKP